MCLTMLPGTGLAAEEPEVKYTKVTEAPTDWSGEYLLVYHANDTDRYVFNGSLDAPDAVNNYIAKTSDDDTIASSADYTVLIEAVTDGYVLKTKSGQYLYVSSDTNGLAKTANQDTAANHPLGITINADGDVKIEVNNGAVMRFNKTSNQMRFRYYKSSGYTNQQPVYLYAVASGDTPALEKTGTPTANVTDGAVYATGETIPKVTLTPAEGATGAVTIYYSTDGTVPTQDAAHTYDTKGEGISLVPGCNVIKAFAVEEGKAKSATLTIRCTVQSDISVALAGKKADSGKFLVEGDVTLVDGKNIYIQDSTGGICAYFANAPTDIELGDTIAVTGTRDEYSGLPELSGASYTKKSDSPKVLTPASKTIAGLAQADICTYVTLTGLKVQSIGEGTNPTLTLSDGTNTIDLYKAVLPTEADKVPAVNDTVTIKGAVGIHSGDFQLRNTKGEEIEVTEKATVVADPTSTPADRGTVAPGGTVTFASATEGASILYSTDNGTNWVDQSTAAYTVPSDAAIDSAITIQVKATKAGLTDSATVTFTYTVKDSVVGKYAKLVTAVPEDGTTQFLLHIDGNVLTGKASGGKLAGEAVTVDHDFIQITEDMALLTATKDANSQYTIQNAEGKYLTCPSGGNGLSFADTAGDYSLWTVAKSGDVFYVNSVNAKYNNNVQGIEYYQGNFTTYSKKTTVAYQATFYAVSDEKPLESVAAPVITPEEGNTPDSSVTVTITCATAGAAIHYTTDGTEPTSASAMYSAPFALNVSGGSATVKAIAVKEGMYNSPVTSKTYQQVVPDQEFVKVLSADEFKTEGYFVLVPKEFPTQALSTSFANKPSPVTVSNPPANGKYAPTLKLAPMNDGVSVQYEVTGKYIGYDSNYSTSFQESDTPYQFNVTGPNDDGAFRFIFSTSTSRAISLQGNTGNVFGAYAINNDGKTTTSTDGTITYGPYECDMLVYKSTKGYLYNPHITFGVLNDAVVGQDWSTTYALEETNKVSNLAAQYSLDGTTWTAATLDETAKTVFVPGNAIAAGHDTLHLKITGTDTRGATVKQMETTAQTVIKDEPMITAVSPAQGAETGAGHLRPTFTATVVNGGTFTAKISIVPKSGAAITDADMTVDTATGVASYTPAGDLAEGWCDVTVTVTRKDGESATKSWSCTVGEAKYVNYFGQLHSHTAEYSDGAGTLASALEYIKNTAYRNNVQFVAFTDHSNYFDTTAAAAPAEALYDVSKLPADAKAKWDAYKKAVADFNKANTGTQVAIAGFEMTWSGGPGHINTFNTPGIVSRNNKDLNNKTNDQGMRDYYSLLSNEKGVESISQFNHPGTTFGTFAEFAYYDPTIDSRITLVEVGNGEGAIGSGGYFPSYSEYIKALDKGWHLAPTNNQDNHKGHWGDANDARTVVYTTDLSENGIYQAMREMRIYATEDKNLDIVYTVNGEKMGTIVNEVPGSAQFKATISDPDVTDKIGTVEIVTNGGAVVYKVENIEAASYELDWTMDAPKAGYYFLRVTQADKDIAVTAPVWLGKAKNVGMSELTCGTAVVVKGEEVTFSNQFFNNEGEAATLLRASYDVNGQLTVNSPNTPIPSMGTVDYSFPYTFNTVGKQTVTLTAVVSIGGEEKTLTSSITVDVKDPDKMIYVGIDGSHHNEYVSGNYKDSMGNFTTLAADYEVRVVVLNTSEQLMNALQNEKYKMMVFTTPTRRLELSVMGQAAYDVYSDTELAAITAFAQRGGTVVVTGWGDYYESYDYCPKDASMQMSAQQNALLAAIGSKLRVADDEAKDEVNKPGSNAARLYLTDYNSFKSPLLAGVDPSQVWSQYGGSTVYAVDDSGAPATVLPDTVTPVISGYGKFESDGTGVDLKNIDSHDEDGDGYMNGAADKTAKPPKYPSDKGTTCLLTATEEVTHANGTKSLVMVSGGAFMSNFEVKFDADNVTQLGYSNPIVLGNLMESLDPKPVRKIADLHAENIPADQEFVVEGVITANTSGYDRETAFFDCTYIQDETGGINVFPVSGNFQVGQRVKVRGIIGGYQGERQLTLSTSDYQGGYIKALSHAPNLTPVTPAQATTKDVAEGKYLGQLVKVQGTVTSVELVNGAVQTIRLKDESDVEARLFIDGYITASKDAALQQRAKVGAKLTAVGLGSYDDTFKEDGSEANRIRIRDRADITGESTGGGSSGSSKDTVVRPGDVKDSEAGVTVALPAADATFTDGAKEKLAELNETKPVTLEGGGLKVVVPAGVIDKDTNPADLLVNPAQAGNAVQVTLPDGTAEIVPFALVTGKSAAYIADREGSYALVDNAKDFVDVPEDFWGADAVAFTAANELFQGTGDNCFTPDGEMTRAMVVTALARLSGAEVDNAVSVFPDVPADTWYTGAVTWAAQAGIVMGDGTNFDPDAPITREALCAILDRFTAYANLTLNQVSDGEGFADAHTVSDWAKESVDAAVKTGLVTGRPGKMIDPAGSATRAEVATVFQRLVKAVLG